jgi:hypothetical protein
MAGLLVVMTCSRQPQGLIAFVQDRKPNPAPDVWF